MHFELSRQLLSIERKHRVMARRAGVFQELEKAISKGFYDSVEDAADRARSIQAVKQAGLIDTPQDPENIV
jgi:DNA sulfur modification protein DndC